MKEYKRFTKEDLCYSEWFQEGNSPSELYYVLKQLEDKIENGTLIELPCKYRDTVWFIYETENDKMFLDEGVIQSFSIDSCGLEFYVIYKSGLTRWHAVESIGERVFLTKPEAKKKLEGLNK